MTEDDLAQVRAALTDEVLHKARSAGRTAAWLSQPYKACASARHEAIKNVLMSALAPLVRPVPTCATCQWADLTYPGEVTCNHEALAYRFDHEGLGTQTVFPLPFGCSLHTPRPSTPEGSASR